MPRYDKEANTIQEEPSALEAFAAGGVGGRRKKGKKGKKQTNRYAGLM